MPPIADGQQFTTRGSSDVSSTDQSCVGVRPNTSMHLDAGSIKVKVKDIGLLVVTTTTTLHRNLE